MKVKIIFSISIVIVGAFLLTTFIAGTLLSKPNPSVIGEPPKNIVATKVSFPSRSGSIISGWHLPGDMNKGGILLMHGVRSNRLQMLKRAKFLHKNGYSVLLFDFQSHGESPGDKITFGVLESLDADAAYYYLRNQLSKKSIGVIGVSLGGAAALMGQVAKKSDALILESVYPTIEEAISNRMTMRLGQMGKYLVPLLTAQMQPRLGFHSDDLRPIEKIANAKGAVMITIGTLDKHTTVQESKRFFDEAHEPKFFWEIGGAAHIDFSHYIPDTYQKKTLWFFGKYMK